MNIRPIGNRVLVRLEPPPTETEGGILLTDYAEDYSRKPSRMAVVVAVGPGAMDRHGKRHPPQVSVGERVWVKRYNEQAGYGYMIPWDKDLRLVSAEWDLLAGSAPMGAEKCGRCGGAGEFVFFGDGNDELCPQCHGTGVAPMGAEE